MRFSRRVAWILAPAFVAGIGCEQILGLDDFTRSDASCEAAACDAGAVDSGPETSAFDVVIPDVVNQASSWANGPMPSSSAEIEAGANPDSGASFIVVDAGSPSVLFDNVGRKLYWNLASSSTDLPTVESAATYCTGLGPGWRVPTRIELVTLLDSTHAAPMVSPALAAGVASARYWTASYVRPIAATGLAYWMVDFANGDVVQVPANGASARVICTLGGT